jgi:hypothetical protein
MMAFEKSGETDYKDELSELIDLLE